eukprot:TRINITY_DN749_c0_g1_i1.p1 TRINITY_DN749_c0_g1~~TRINITY_DN749_c0_g1_i1.p1  ORF type:complete len:74 (+),score=5.43 TRINITY_DN749_c0_g1_i1:265-486(+)
MNVGAAAALISIQIDHKSRVLSRSEYLSIVVPLLMFSAMIIPKMKICSTSHPRFIDINDVTWVSLGSKKLPIV